MTRSIPQWKLRLSETFTKLKYEKEINVRKPKFKVGDIVRIFFFFFRLAPVRGRHSGSTISISYSNFVNVSDGLNFLEVWIVSLYLSTMSWIKDNHCWEPSCVNFLYSLSFKVRLRRSTTTAFSSLKVLKM